MSTILCQDHLAESTFSDRFDDFVVLALESLAHILESTFVTTHLVHNLNINKKTSAPAHFSS